MSPTSARMRKLIEASSQAQLAEALMSVLDEHRPDKDGDCEGCYEPLAEHRRDYSWPCATVSTALGHLPGGEYVEAHAAELRKAPW
ncbi:hypothetical protein [Nocardiopsis synnemataformans]|uniref:hypothetical protein n=1 Tax=Nocardiopsis synnemataformans TaxID=61305 RepID=UPI003EB7F1D3